MQEGALSEVTMISAENAEAHQGQEKKAKCSTEIYHIHSMHCHSNEQPQQGSEMNIYI